MKKEKLLDVETVLAKETPVEAPVAPAAPKVETHTFVTKDGAFQLTVKKDFLLIVAEPEKVDVQVLFSKHNMTDYLHNEDGPAIVSLTDNHTENWLNGKRVSVNEVK